MNEDLVASLEGHLATLVGKRMAFPGGKGAPFTVTSVAGETVQVHAGGTPISIPKAWIRQAVAVLARTGALTRSGLDGQTARYRSGNLFALIGAHPRVHVVRDFPTKLTLTRRVDSAEG